MTEKEQSAPTLSIPHTVSNDAEQRTLTEEPSPDKVEPVDLEQKVKEEPGARWRDAEVHEIPYK